MDADPADLDPAREFTREVARTRFSNALVPCPWHPEADLEPLFDFLLERELSCDGGDLSLPTQAIAALRSGIATLKTSPFTCRKTGQSPFLRELIVPFGRSGCAALFEIEDETSVAVLAVRDQRADNYH